MADNIIKSFLNFPQKLEDFPTYEEKIHSEILNQINEIRILILKIMKNVKLTDRKLLLELKNKMDVIKSSFEIISSSIFDPKITTERILSQHHESVIVLDFLLLDRFIDFFNGIRNLEKTSTEEAFSLKNNSALIESSLKKLEKLVRFREITQNIAPTKEFFKELETEFSGDINYLDFLGVLHEYDELAKPLRGDTLDYYTELKRHFSKTCISLIEEDKKNISFIEFLKFFERKYPGIEFENMDMEKVARELSSAGFISLTKDSLNTPITILLEADSTIQKEILELATEKGFTTQDEIIKELSLPVERTLEIIEKLEQTGLALVDDYTSGKRVYFPGLYKDEENN